MQQQVNFHRIQQTLVLSIQKSANVKIWPNEKTAKTRVEVKRNQFLKVIRKTFPLGTKTPTASGTFDVQFIR
jgi:hypothetical protein